MELLVYGMTLGKKPSPSKSQSASYRFLCIFARVEMLQYHEDCTVVCEWKESVRMPEKFVQKLRFLKETIEKNIEE